MIAKCIAVLAIVAQINAYVCEPGCGPVSVGGPVVGGPVGCAAPVVGAPDLRPVTKNIVAKGKYPVALVNCGPNPDNRIPVTTSSAVAPVQQKPTVRLPYTVPAPRVVAHSCTCYKTILKPRVHQHIVTVPTVQRYIETTHRPIVENIQYEGVPVTCPGNDFTGPAPAFAAPAFAAPAVAAPAVAAPAFAAPAFAAPAFATSGCAAPAFAAPSFSAPVYSAPAFATSGCAAPAFAAVPEVAGCSAAC